MHATAYVITGRISGTDPSFLTWPLLRALEMRGIEIGCHSVTHADLPTLPDATVTAELTRSRRALECALHHPVPWFAYPYGHFDARVESLARKAGYLLDRAADAAVGVGATRARRNQNLRLDRRRGASCPAARTELSVRARGLCLTQPLPQLPCRRSRLQVPAHRSARTEVIA
jgi:peptidoglycan/xylan/chitin deacetylase (PgdA/CDA1 family)